MIATVVSSDSAYTVLYDASREALRSLWIVAIPLAFATAIATYMYFAVGSSKGATGDDDDEQGTKAGFAIMFLLGITCILLIPMTFLEYWKFVTRMSTGDVRITTGIVTNFVPEPRGGHRYETFAVNDVRFEYSTYNLTGAFNKTAPHGGPIHNGMHLRIADIDGAIVRLDQLQPSPDK